jgi:hypothetical protein
MKTIEQVRELIAAELEAALTLGRARALYTHETADSLWMGACAREQFCMDLLDFIDEIKRK